MWFEGLTIMILGMSVVFCFLSILVFLIWLLTKIIKPEESVAEGIGDQIQTKSIDVEQNKNIIAAITIALHKYRTKR